MEEGIRLVRSWLCTFRPRLRRWRLRLSRRAADRDLARVLATEGQINEAEAAHLMRLAGEVPPGQVIVEIGSYRGRSTLALACGTRAANGCRVYAVDPHAPFTGLMGATFGPLDQAALYENICRVGVGDLVAVVSLPSEQIGRLWPDSNVGLLWVDGDHRYEAVKADIDAWFDRVASGGTLAFHDAHCVDVARALGEMVARGGVHEAGGVASMRWFTKQGVTG